MVLIFTKVAGKKSAILLKYEPFADVLQTLNHKNFLCFQNHYEEDQHAENVQRKKIEYKKFVMHKKRD